MQNGLTHSKPTSEFTVILKPHNILPSSTFSIDFNDNVTAYGNSVRRRNFGYQEETISTNMFFDVVLSCEIDFLYEDNIQ